MNKNRKAQITLFVILGLVLLIIFVILISLKKCTEPQTNDVQKILSELETGSIKNHVTNCIIQTAMDGLEKIGENGGLIYDFQGGKIPFAHRVIGRHYLNYTPPDLEQTYFVAYGLKENTFCENVTYKSPDYPYPDTPFSKLNTIYSAECGFGTYNHPHADFYGFFGQNDVMTKLCYAARESSCEGFAKAKSPQAIGFSIQMQLEDYVTSKLPLCINLSAFTSRIMANISVEAKPVVEVDIHTSEIVILVKYPIKISFENQEPVTKVIDYQTTLKVRLGLIYNFIYDLLSMDSRKIDFDIKKNYLQSAYYRGGLELKNISNPSLSYSSYDPDYFLPFFYDDIIEVRDRKSLVNGRPFVFRVGVQNRKPALDLINDINLTIEQGSWAVFQVISLSLNGSDPDDNPVNYMFLSQGPGDGWKEDDIIIKSNLKNGLLMINIEPRQDSGTHEVGILALDDSGLFDYQWFWININYSRTYDSNTPKFQKCLKDCIVFHCSMNGNPYSCGCSNATQWNIGEDYSKHHDCSSSNTDLLLQKPYDPCCLTWCSIAAGECNSKCHMGFANYDNPYGSDCWKCVDPIVHSDDKENHIDCFDLAKEQCISHMPDCFWVRENVSNTFIESCYNDTSLNETNHPAYIITTTNLS